ncbi:hypothetical protein CSOJ01_09763 [Colletotrichum sojae]|uniref:C2H2-type domain-containing protein n=1 Tax=Colletotrichum sojae TaxID=2175907 RepID=A0A8H6J290_9PEZI|nr:hypothetical protein CSOJ01_09763 [Colletotrichum sojae]
MSATSPGAFRRGAQDPLLSLNEEDFEGYETHGSFAETAEDPIRASLAFEYASGLMNDGMETARSNDELEGFAGYGGVEVGVQEPGLMGDASNGALETSDTVNDTLSTLAHEIQPFSSPLTCSTSTTTPETVQILSPVASPRVCRRRKRNKTPVSCSYCQLPFPRITERNKHVRTKHLPEIECPLCPDLRFPYNKDMHRHVWNAHKLYAADPRNKIRRDGGDYSGDKLRARSTQYNASTPGIPAASQHPSRYFKAETSAAMVGSSTNSKRCSLTWVTKLCKELPPLNETANPDVSGIRLRGTLAVTGLDSSWLRDEGRGRELEKVFDKCILAMSDIQIVTGLAILISAFHGPGRSLSGYHWQIIIYTVAVAFSFEIDTPTVESLPFPSWFSAVTHLAALTHLRNLYANHFNMCVWRLVLVFCVVAMLLAAMVIGVPAKGTLLNPAGHSSIQSHYAICYWDSESELTSKPETIFSGIETSLSAWFLVFGFASRVLKMNRRVSKWWFSYRKKTRESLRRFASGEGVWLCQALGPKVFGLMIASPLIACRIFGRTYLELFTSLFAEVVWLSVTASWGLTRLMGIRKNRPDEGDDWTFGQLASVVLFASPLLIVLERPAVFCERLVSLPWNYNSSRHHCSCVLQCNVSSHSLHALAGWEEKLRGPVDLPILVLRPGYHKLKDSEHVSMISLPMALLWLAYMCLQLAGQTSPNRDLGNEAGNC